MPVFENFRPAFSLDPIDYPWVSEDDIIYTTPTIELRASFSKYQKSGDSFKIFTFFIFCPNKAFSELFSKIQLKDPKALEAFQNRGKFENRHFGLRRHGKLTKRLHFRFARAGKRDNI